MRAAGLAPKSVLAGMLSLSGVGITLGTLFFAAALTPTLVPRSFSTQGVLAGACFAIGYGAGVLWRWLWQYLELPEPPQRLRARVNLVVAALAALVALVFLWRAAEWQNSIRSVMGLAPVETAHPFKVCAIALVTFAVILALARLFALVARGVRRLARRCLPPRLAAAIGVAVAALAFWTLTNDIAVRGIFHMLDTSFREYDALLEPERPQPSQPGKTGSPASLVRWETLGRAGREYVASGPSAQDISAFNGRPAREPLRVYVGLRGEQTPAGRAHLALEELKRQGGFERAALIVVTPTGTGWIDPAAMDSAEYLFDGDVASVAVQYSYLSSPLSLLAQPEYGGEAARALFAEIYGYWTGLPKDARPRLYLHGLSLGAMNSEKSAELFEMIGDPVDGALWSGPPFPSRIHTSLTAQRNPGTPMWLPQFRDGRFARFMNQTGSPVPSDAPWGPMRIVYLQYASDPIIFFDYRDSYRAPEWMQAPRGPDVSPELRWYPVVTMLQMALDMAVATATPIGHGHVYAPEDYVGAWIAVTGLSTWSQEALTRLKRHLGEMARQADDGDDSREDRYDNRGG